MEADDPSCPSPYAHPSDFLLKDISNFKTPKRPYPIPNFFSPSTQFLTASKETPQPSPSFLVPPSVSSRSRLKYKSANARRLMAIELEQSQSSRKVQIQKERSLRSLSKSLTTWLNFLFESPTSCGCNVLSGSGNNDVASTGSAKRDGEIMSCMALGVGTTLRFPKRQRDLTWKPADESGKKKDASLSSKVLYGTLQHSLKDVCSFDDLKQRMEAHLDFVDRNEIFTVMASVVKNIDGGRLTMKAHCPIVTDVGLKRKATLVLMHYNPSWLRIGLYVIFGGDSLLPDGESNSDLEISFLKMVIEKHFFSHDALARAYAYNKTVEGLYRPGYYEQLGNLILKRFFLLVLVLDRAKSQSSLPLKYGIDGLDGGSPPLFMAQSSIKSSRQVINDFLSSDVMHGEGNLLSHLVTIGCRLTFEQGFLAEYDFKMEDLFAELHDGVRLCRAVQLITNNPSILLKIVAPSDLKKKLANCSAALQYLKQAGVQLCDEEGITVVEDDIVGGDKELTVSLLWNMFVHLQLPRVVNKSVLAEETLRIRGSGVDLLEHKSLSSSHVELLFNWVQATCERYDHKHDNFSSMVDGKGIWCLLDFYFHKELGGHHHSFKDSRKYITEESITLGADYFDAVYSFLSSHKLTSLLWNSLEVLKLSEVPEHNGMLVDRAVLILVVFVASQLLMKQSLDKPNSGEVSGRSPERRYSSIRRHFNFKSQKLTKSHEGTDMQNVEDARRYEAIKIWWAESADVSSWKNDFIRNDATQRGKWHESQLCVKSNYEVAPAGKDSLADYLAATKIQSCIRGWRWRRKFLCQKWATVRIQSRFRSRRCCGALQHLRIYTRSAIIVQAHVHGWLTKRSFLLQRRAAIAIQGAIRLLNGCNTFRHREPISRNGLPGPSHFRSSIPSDLPLEIPRCWFQHAGLKVILSSVLKLQRWWRCSLLLARRTKASTIIQSGVRCWIVRKRASGKRQHYVALIQSCWRDYLARKKPRKQLLDLCLPGKACAENVNIIINVDIIGNLRLALRHLRKTQSASEILHICTIFDTFTHCSRTYCEELVAAGAVEALLELIRSGSRSIPDQEILKLALSVLCNLVRHAHLAEFLVDSDASLEILLWEFLRNKEEGYFIVAEMLKRICSIQKGAEALQNLPAWKRVHSLVEELTRKAQKCTIIIDKRKPRSREDAERRLIEAEELLNLTGRNNSLSSA